MHVVFNNTISTISWDGHQKFCFQSYDARTPGHVVVDCKLKVPTNMWPRKREIAQVTLLFCRSFVCCFLWQWRRRPTATLTSEAAAWGGNSLVNEKKEERKDRIVESDGLGRRLLSWQRKERWNEHGGGETERDYNHIKYRWNYGIWRTSLTIE